MNNVSRPPQLIVPPKRILLKDKVLPPLVPSSPVISPVSSTTSKPIPERDAEAIKERNEAGKARIDKLVAKGEALQVEIITLFKSKTILTKATKEKLQKKFVDYSDINLAIINETMNIVSDELDIYKSQ